jgi:L-ascorbate metabolism protein UlaG (beta-lactamase superfamily)
MLRIAALLLSLSSLPFATQSAASGGVQPFGAGVLDGGEIFRGSFAPDGRSFYFFRKVGAGEEYRIFVSHRSGETWGAPAVVRLGGEFSDLYPSISRDGRRMVFSSYRPVPGAASSVKPNAHLWYVDRANDGWGAPVYMRQASTPGHYHSWVELGFDDAVYFRRTSADWKVTETLRSVWTGSAYGAPAPYADAERWKGWRSDVRVVGGSPGPGGTLVFLDVATTNPRTGRSASDIWISRKRGDAWTDPAPLGAGINSDGFDVFPFVSPDGRDLYFVRDFATFHRVPLADALASVDANAAVRYVANSGMLLTHSRRRFLIDAPIRDGIQPYATSTADERQRLETARAPYAEVDAILVTHWHEDHFSAEAIAAYLTHNPRTVLVSSPEVVDRVRTAAAGLPPSRYRAILPDPGAWQQVDVGGVPVRVLRIRHNPARRFPEQHVGFLVGADAPVLHVGDADPAADNFSLMRSLPAVDLAMLPFWYVSDESNRRMVADLLRPRRIIAMHVPPGDASRIEASLRAAGVSAVVAAEPGTALR